MTQPYFYIIEHIQTGKRYVGSRWAKDCNPSELLQIDGYLTSSNIIQNIILNEGIQSFRIIEIIESDNPYLIETQFLLENDCAQSDMWFNKHNNEGRPPAFGTEEFRQSMIEKYGVEHNTSIPEVKAKMIATAKETYKNNPEMLHQRALKIAENKRKNGTTGKGVKRPNYKNNGLNGKWKRTEYHREMISKRVSEQMYKNNPMNIKENRDKVAASKIGRKKVINPLTNQIKMVYPDNIPKGFILYSEFFTG